MDTERALDNVVLLDELMPDEETGWRHYTAITLYGLLPCTVCVCVIPFTLTPRRNDIQHTTTILIFLCICIVYHFLSDLVQWFTKSVILPNSFDFIVAK